MVLAGGLELEMLETINQTHFMITLSICMHVYIYIYIYIVFSWEPLPKARGLSYYILNIRLIYTCFLNVESRRLDG